MRKKGKLTREFWERDAANRKELEKRVAYLDAKRKQERTSLQQRPQQP